MSEFPALVLEEKDGKVTASVRQMTPGDLPDGDVLVRVSHSTLNYKDGLVLGGLGKLVRTYPHVPGVDFAGEVVESSSPHWRPGDAVVLTGWRVGELRHGGYAGMARVKGEWLVRLPKGLGPRQAMAVGTAGFTAMLAIMRLEAHGLAPERGEVLVTGAAGGLGSLAVALLERSGYQVAASTGRAETHDYLKALGAQTIVARDSLNAADAKPLQSERWAGAIDTVGGTTLVNVLAQTRYGCAVAACGNAGGNALPGTVLPFLLRGVSLLGIDSVMRPTSDRKDAWGRIAAILPRDVIDSMATDIALADLPGWGKAILAGKVRGRVVVDMTRSAGAAPPGAS
jgi:acrylyl-CoA reductase (NADPH)